VVVFSELGITGRRSSLRAEETSSVVGPLALASLVPSTWNSQLAICCVDLRVLEREGEQLHTWGS